MDDGQGYADGTDAAVVAAVRGWLAAGHGVHLVTVVRTWGSSPRPPGALMARREDGHTTVGSVSGGCVESAIAEHLPTAGQTPAILTWSGDEARRAGLPCGGTLELLAERLEPRGERGLGAVAAALERGEAVRRRVECATGTVAVEGDEGGPDVVAAGDCVDKRFGPAWRLLIVGAGELGSHLAAMARRLGYQVTVCEPREEVRAAFGESGVELTGTMPDDAVASLAPGERDAVVTTTHDPRLDDLALEAVLATPAGYIGALGSKRTNDQRRERLREQGLPPEAVARLRGPVGLAIGSRTPAEIAVSILAEMTAQRRNAAESA